MKYFLIVVAIVAIFLGYQYVSKGGPIQRRVNQYGADRFTREALTFRASGKLPESLEAALAPKKTALRSRGVFLIYKDSGGTTEGIYVDPVNLSLLDSSVELVDRDDWTSRVAWIKEKRNQTPEVFKKAARTLETAREFKERRPEVPDEL